MALIKCRECGKQISDKASACPKCGCPVKKKITCSECGKEIKENDKVCPNCGCPIQVEEHIQRKNNQEKLQLPIKIWLVVCIIACFLICALNVFNVLSIETFSIVIGEIRINIIAVLSLILGISYINLIRKPSKYNLYITMFINLIILLVCFSNFGMIALVYMACAFINSIITFLWMRKNTYNIKYKFKDYLLTLGITLVGIIMIVFISSFNYSSDYYANSNNNEESNSPVFVSLFYMDECKHCDDAKEFLNNYKGYDITFKTYNIGEEQYAIISKNIALNFQLGEGYPLILVNDTPFVGFDENIKEQIKEEIKNEALNNNTLDYVEEMIKGNITIDTRTPKEKFIEALLARGFTTSNNNLYHWSYGYTGNDMYSEVDLKKGIYTDFASTSGLSMLTQYKYKDQAVVFTFKYSSYWATINWNLKTERWNCTSSINDWCETNGQKYVSENMNNAINDFNEYLTKAGATLEDITE